ncbi:MAG: hypothetical protein WCJ24_02715 [Candidatus Saccharibacteria bacterium]
MPKNKDQPAAEAHPKPTSVPPLPDAPAIEPDEVDPVVDQTTSDDPEIDQAIDEITTQEADDILEVEDAELAKSFEPQIEPRGLKAKVTALVSAWWHNKKARYGTFVGLAILFILSFAIPPSRYFILNTSGVRGSASLVVIDQSTQQPLKNVDVVVAGQSVKTDTEGVAKLTHLKLGSTQLVIKRRAFAPVTKMIVVGWGSNPYGRINLEPTGSQYNYVITDFLSGKGVAQAEASTTDADAAADDKGNLVLTVDPSQSSPLQVTIKADGYRDEVVSLNLDDKSTHKLDMVPSHKHTFISKRSGKYDLYAIDVDGKNESLLLAGTGHEREDLVVTPSPSTSLVALSSSRDNVRNKDGFLLTSLNLVDTKTGKKTQISQSENIQIVDWFGSRIVFVEVGASSSADNPNRQRLISYDTVNNSQKVLATSNYFNDVLSASGNIYYAPSDSNASKAPGFYKTNPEGTDNVNILNKITWNILRTQNNQMTLSVGGDWYNYKLGDVSATKLNGAPANTKNRLYQDDSEHKHSLWVDSRDGRGVLIKTDTTSQQETVIRTQSGLVKPFYWLNDHYAVYRIHTDQETADYVINLEGGQARKISNVNNTAGLGNWYYY